MNWAILHKSEIQIEIYSVSKQRVWMCRLKENNQSAYIEINITQGKHSFTMFDTATRYEPQISYHHLTFSILHLSTDNNWNCVIIKK